MSEQCLKSETPLGVAVVGAGGQEWARAFNALGVLRAATGPDALAEALADPRVAGVAVAVAGPVRELGEIVRRALAAGKHVLAQAPLALDDAEAACLMEMAKGKNLMLMAGHPILSHPAVGRLRDMVAAGEIGRIRGVYASNLGDDDGTQDGWSGVLRDISMILAMAGESPQAVLAMGDDRIVVIHLVFPDQRQAHLFVSRQHPFGEQKLVVVGERQTAFFDDVPPLGGELVLYPRPVSGNSRTPAQGQRVDLPQGEPLAAQCRKFLDAMASGRLPDGDDGLQALRVLCAVRKSLKEGGVRVSLATAPAPDYFAHPTAVIDAGVTIGAGTKIWHFSHVLKGSRLGERCNLGQNVVVGPDVSVGSGCKIQNNVSVYQGVTLEDDVFCGPSMVFTNIFNPRAHVPRMHEVRRTLVKHGAALGANCTIVCGVAVGRYAFVGAGAVVTRDVPDHAVVVGNPARRIGWMCACGEKLDESLRCAVCGAAYAVGETGLRRL